MIADLEARQFDAWPAARVEPHDGWRLRATSGVTRRANSAWTSGVVSDLDEAIARSEAFYAACRQAAIFQLSPLSPPELDQTLAARGYEVDAPVAILTVELERLGSEVAPKVETWVESRISSDWLELAGARTRFAPVQGVFRGILERIGASGSARPGYALASVDGEPAATALGVCDGDWLGVFSVATLPASRRRGAATALLAALKAWSQSLGAVRGYLQVERDNRVAFDLYRRDGFREAYGYHYRIRPE